MKLDLETQKKLASEWFKFLQLKIFEEFQYLEKEFSKRKKVVPKYFKKNDWKKESFGEGGGTYYIIKNGQLFEKVGINHSTVKGIFPKKFRGNIPGTKKNNSYWASGISIVAHMKNPKIPAMHFNTRFVVTSKSWFGGGMDVTPSFKDLNEKKFGPMAQKKRVDFRPAFRQVVATCRSARQVVAAANHLFGIVRLICG